MFFMEKYRKLSLNYPLYPSYLEQWSFPFAELLTPFLYDMAHLIALFVDDVIVAISNSGAVKVWALTGSESKVGLK